MKGKDKRKAKGKGNKPNGKAKRDALRQNNRTYNAQMKAKTKLRRMQRGQPGTPQGKHVKNMKDCKCGGCSAGFVRS